MPAVVEHFTDVAGLVRHAPEATIAWLRARLGVEADERSPIVIARGDRWRFGPGRLQLESGERLEIGDEPVDDLPLGYHRFTAEGTERFVVVAPAQGLVPHEREWGWATQLYATRSADSCGVGDLGDLARLARWARRECGAQFVLVNPLSANAPGRGQQASPYSPTSRRFLNPLYADVREMQTSPAVAAAVPGIEGRIAALNAARVIDRDHVLDVKMAVLEATFASGVDHATVVADDALVEFATWTALAEQHGPDWRVWPEDLRHPGSEAVRHFAAQHRERILFHCWVQHLLREQLAEVRRETRLVQDLPIGFDAGGMDAWAWQDLLALDASVGAPPDEFNTRGQDWGLPPFIPAKLRAADYRPFIETVRACLAHDGALRIDHVMGLFRLWWIPDGMSAVEGAFVRYPAQDLLAILLLECARANAIAIGEDLGTVEPDAREQLTERNVLSYQVLWFEQDPPSTWKPNALAAVTTHDLPTVAGLWDHSDIRTQIELDLQPNVESTAEIRDRLETSGGLAHDAPAVDAIRAAHRLLAGAPARMVVATLDDATVVSERPNMPGADGRRPNWSLALPMTLDEIEHAPLPREIAAILRGSRTGLRSPGPSG